MGPTDTFGNTGAIQGSPVPTAQPTTATSPTASYSAPATGSAGTTSTASAGTSATPSGYNPQWSQYLSPDMWKALGDPNLTPTQFGAVLNSVNTGLQNTNTLIDQKNAVIQAMLGGSVPSDKLAKLPPDIQNVINSGNRDALMLQAQALNDQIRGYNNSTASTLSYLSNGYFQDQQLMQTRQQNAISNILDIAKNFVIPNGQPGAGQVDLQKLKTAIQSMYPGINVDGILQTLQGMMPVSEYNKTFYQGFNVQNSLNGVSGVSSDPAMNAMNSIVGTESGGNYQAVSPAITSGQYAGHQSYGKYQVLDVHVPDWTLAAGFTGSAPNGGMTPQEFLNSQAAQEAVAQTQFHQLWSQYGNIQDVASVWFSGMPYQQAVAAGAKDPTTGMTVQQYVQNATDAFNQSQNAVQNGGLGLGKLPPGQPATPDNIAAWQRAQAIMDGTQPPINTAGGMASKSVNQMSAYWKANGNWNEAQAWNDWQAVQKQIAAGNSISADRMKSSETTALGYISTLNDMLTSSSGTFKLEGKTYKTWSNAAGNTPLTYANYQLALQGAYGADAQQTAQAITTQITDLENDMASVYRFGLAPTDSSRKAAADTIQSYWGNNRLEATLPVLSQNISARVDAFRGAVSSPITPGGGENPYASGSSSNTPGSTSGTGATSGVTPSGIQYTITP